MRKTIRTRFIEDATMANTKKIEDKKMRKGIKRAQRRSLKALELTLKTSDRKKLRKEPQGIREYIAAKEKAAAEAAAEE